jgi:hypothetical protein
VKQVTPCRNELLVDALELTVRVGSNRDVTFTGKFEAGEDARLGGIPQDDYPRHVAVRRRYATRPAETMCD